MNKRIFIPTAILLIAILLSGCGLQMVSGSGKLATENRPVGAYSRITLAGIGDVQVTQGDTTSLRIEAEDNLMQYFDTSVQGDTLTIGIKPEYAGINLLPTRPVKFFVTTPNVAALTLAGSGNITAGPVESTDFAVSLLGSGNISTDRLAATGSVDASLKGSGNITFGAVTTKTFTSTIAGSGNVKLSSLAADSVKATTTGSGDFSASGSAGDQHIEILGSGDYLAGSLNSKTATIRVTGSGSSQVAVSDNLDVTILGSGDVLYSGSPTMNVNIAGSGKVNQAGK
jgi:hypothetical protein